MENKEVIGYYQVERKERIYFLLKLSFSIIIIASFVALTFILPELVFLPILFYALSITFYILLFRFIRAGLLKGFLKNNSVLITNKQLPEIYSIVEEYCSSLGIKKIPKVFLLESGGQLNAFAAKLHTKNYIVVFSELLEEFYDGNEETVRFVIAHELGHIKQKHILKSALTFPSAIIPFLNMAYSRACEYTCDNIGIYFSQKGAEEGIVTLAAGKKLNKKISKEEFINQIDYEAGFWSWFAEKLSSHPHLNKRLRKAYKKKWTDKLIEKKEEETAIKKELIVQPKLEKQETDHSKYMPKF